MKTNNLKIVLTVLTLTIGLFIWQGCSNDFDFNTNFMNNSEKELAKQHVYKPNELWKEQLNNIKDTRSLIEKDNNLQLLSYKLETATIENNKQLTEIKKEVLSDESIVPYYENDNINRIKLLKKKTAKMLASSKQSYSDKRLSDFLNKTIKKGMKVVLLEWQHNNSTFHTKCIVSPTDGIVYDNIITNTLIIKPLSEKKITRIKTKSREGTGNNSGTTELLKTNVTGSTAYWLFGSERGEAKIVNTVRGKWEGEKKSITSSTSTADAYISIGSSDAKIKKVSEKLGTDGYVSVSYAYFLATPLVSISIKLNGVYYTVECNSSFGSKISGEGVFGTSPNDLN